MLQSQKLQLEGRKRIPGMTQLLSKRPDMFSLGVWPGYYSRAKGAKVWDLDGREYLDMSIGGIGACVLGYADDEVDDAVARVVRNGVACSLNCPEEVELANLLCDVHPWADMVRYARGGGEALSIAVRIARAYTGRDVVACCGYHGWSDWYLAANLAEDSALDGHLMPGLAPSGVPRGLQGSTHTFRYNHPEELCAIVEKHGRSLAAVVMEPVRSAMPDPGFIETVRQLVDDVGAVLIMDEVSAGFRYCLGGAHLVLHQVQPDMAVFSKALGNGYAISAVIGKADVMQAAQKTFISSTNWTERVGPAAALACMKAYARRKPYEKFTRLGQRIKKSWVELGAAHGFAAHAEGMDAMSHFVFDEDDFLAFKAYFVQCMLEEGILASSLCYLMDAHTDADVERYLAACGRSFAKLADAKKAGDIHERLKGAPATSGFKRLA
ncbi:MULTISPECIES: aminotransferase class III-fold pyridoxal phosphate-dependent enzyme [unclassified Desulfovibrio]|uniref:aminotransferase class III-fold pyridoxal phosphate-dependent enzyme n=1 Tax=unclassified Desulfovibrio TaxID=2593640 RepID=UPI000F5DFE93|nr:MULTISPECIES: aminotransferase class III-fold pyridoxal phosphate-dependent enzyme [unclassified Desulfovibrio]RRD71729.1 aminotransferase class III-fold pyridoxal phosphate-dependent enzyme [Desulfovibrio sp. OH1209_COT-279]RRD87942.1 aminotransferase class III-fold pyridoxal phosphate-dependent enzyme [Desulfovibrio sp. OH1186_COT-070]